MTALMEKIVKGSEDFGHQVEVIYCFCKKRANLPGGRRRWESLRLRMPTKTIIVHHLRRRLLAR